MLESTCFVTQSILLCCTVRAAHALADRVMADVRDPGNLVLPICHKAPHYGLHVFQDVPQSDSANKFSSSLHYLSLQACAAAKCWLAVHCSSKLVPMSQAV